jgi:hypothetical protein
MIWKIVNQPYELELWIMGIWMMHVATAKKRSKQFVFSLKNDRQSGNEIANLSTISAAKMPVAMVSMTSTLALDV